MKTIKITTDNILSVIDINLNNYRELQKAVGNGCDCVETVKTMKLYDFFGTEMLFIVDESGLLRNLPVNQVGCYFYGTWEYHGCPIVGDIVFGVPDCEDLRAPEDIDGMKKKLLEAFPFLSEEVANE